MNAYWRAANYLSVGQIYLYDNPLLKEPLTLAHVKPLVVGHWGTTPGQNFIYVHLNRVIRKYDLDMLYVAGPGHGGPAIVGHVYLEGTWSEVYPNITQDEAGLKKLFTQFSFPGGISSHVAPRPDSTALVAQLKTLGVRVVMVTGDAPATADIVARAVGLEGKVSPPGATAANLHPGDFAVFAGILPEGKFQLVKAFQKSGHTVGMCGDGVNDAPALRQAQMGIAVSTATDVAKSAAGIVLTEPGLGGIVESVKVGRVTFQRVLTYTLNSVTNKIAKVFFLAAGLFMTGHAILTPLLMVISMLGGDLLGMSVTTDNVQPSVLPNSWRVRQLILAGIFMGGSELIFYLAALTIGRLLLGPGIESIRTLAFVIMVFGNQALTYLNRDRRRLGSSRPSWWLVGSSAVDVTITSILAIFGIAMAPLPYFLVAGVLIAAPVFAFVIDFAKVPVFRRLAIV